MTFRDTGGVQTPEQPTGRPERNKAAVSHSHKVAVRPACSSPLDKGNEQGGRRYTGYHDKGEMTHGKARRSGSCPRK